MCMRDDVAQMFIEGDCRTGALRSAKPFHAVSPAAVSLRGLCRKRRPPGSARRRSSPFLPWPEWKAAQTKRGGRHRDVGAHRAEPELEHRARPGAAASAISPALHLVRGGVQSPSPGSSGRRRPDALSGLHKAAPSADGSGVHDPAAFIREIRSSSLRRSCRR